MRKKIRVFLASCVVTALMVSASMAAVSTGDPTKKGKESVTTYKINSVTWEQTPEEYLLRIKGDSTPTYTMYELFEPLRVIVDIANASLDPSTAMPTGLTQGPVSNVNGKLIADKEPTLTRIEILLRNEHNYTVERTNYDILVKFPISSTIPQGDDINRSSNSISRSLPTPNTSTDKSENHLATKLEKIEISKSAEETRILLRTDGAINNFKKILLEKNPASKRPDRMYIDLNNIRLIGPAETIHVGTSISNIRSSKRQDGIRIVFESGLDHLFDYSISKQPDGLLVTTRETSSQNNTISNVITAAASDNPAPAEQQTVSPDNSANYSSTQKTYDSEPTKPTVANNTVVDESDINTNQKQGLAKYFKPPTPRDLSFAGYNKQRITVDFYKIDLHNVFRLFGDISNLNIVVDEAVNGSLTLALNDVPWDFALDIILNLKDLQKEERFNTIVISPKSKLFTWPERALDNVEFKSDIKIQQTDQDQGGLQIKKRIEIPDSIVEAKKLIHQANLLERKGDYSAALPLYEEAFTKWGDNVGLAKKIAAICLVNLEQNAKAVHYAKSVLKINPRDADASLQGAIGLARMKKDTEAKDFFEQSVSGDKPPSESLVSYSAFCEEQQDLGCSLTQLKRHEDLYGDNLTTMVSKARIYDKQGNREQAALEYQTILLSGFELPADLNRYIKGRASFAGR